MPAFELDIRTLFFTQVLINLTLGLALWVATRGRYQYGLNYFIALFLLQAFVQGLYFLRGILPDFLTIVIANVLVVTTYNLGYMGYCRFFNKDPNWQLMITPVVIILIVFSIYIDNFHIRVITLGLVSSGQYFIQFMLLLHAKSRGVKRSKPILLAAYGMIIILFATRAVYMILNPDAIRNMFDPGIINSITLFATILSIVLIAIGVLLMLSESLLEENRELATRDWLTHIFNRRTFTDLAKRELGRATRNDHETSLLMIDIDHFKLVNDSFGHPTGDEALIHLVRIIKDSVRVQDLYARFGGEEFVVLLAETSTLEAYQIAERLRERVADSTLVINNNKIKMTVSIGISTAIGYDTPDLETMINQADIAMYEAKNAGRNCTRVFKTDKSTVQITTDELDVAI